MLTPVEERLREELSNPNNRLRSQRAVVNSDDGKWPNGIVPYEIDNSLSECTECGSLMCIYVAGGWCHTLVASCVVLEGAMDNIPMHCLGNMLYTTFSGNVG